MARGIAAALADPRNHAPAPPSAASGQSTAAAHGSKARQAPKATASGPAEPHSSPSLQQQAASPPAEAPSQQHAALAEPAGQAAQASNGPAAQATGTQSGSGTAVPGPSSCGVPGHSSSEPHCAQCALRAAQNASNWRSAGGLAALGGQAPVEDDAASAVSSDMDGGLCSDEEGSYSEEVSLVFA